jgi:hypothetical protein
MIKYQFTMFSDLHAEGPAADIKSQMMLYGQFVGSWQGRVVVHTPDGKRGEAGCEVHFGWVLEGRAVQDVWIAPSRSERQGSKIPARGSLYGTTLRVYDPKNDLWHILWINPVTQSFDSMIGRKVGADIVQEYHKEDGTQCQWCFTEITANSFHWLSRESKDEGKTWNILNEFFVRRMASD